MWQLGAHQFNNHLILGTASYPSLSSLKAAIELSNTDLVTVSMRQARLSDSTHQAFTQCLSDAGVKLLPNTAGCKTAKEAIQYAKLARKLFKTDLIKLEIILEQDNLTPNSMALIEAATTLCEMGMIVMPYCTEDLATAEALVHAGCKILMPWAAPIGSGQGILNPSGLMRLRAYFPDILLAVDAGIARPSEAMAVMEMGYDVILLNSAVALSQNPEAMAFAFSKAIEMGRIAHQSGFMGRQLQAVPTTPSLDVPFERIQLC